MGGYFILQFLPVFCVPVPILFYIKYNPSLTRKQLKRLLKFTKSGELENIAEKLTLSLNIQTHLKSPSLNKLLKQHFINKKRHPCFRCTISTNWFKVLMTASTKVNRYYKFFGLNFIWANDGWMSDLKMIEWESKRVTIHSHCYSSLKAKKLPFFHLGDYNITFHSMSNNTKCKQQ